MIMLFKICGRYFDYEHRKILKLNEVQRYSNPSTNLLEEANVDKFSAFSGENEKEGLIYQYVVHRTLLTL